MYNQEKEGFSVRDILIQVLFIILFVFILVWLFPTKSNVNKVNDKLDILTGTIFNANIQTMKEAAVSYYTVQRLPQKLNDVKRMTLKDMLDEKLLIEFVDGNGKQCDNKASYVEVIKLEDEYQMKINLSCSDNDAYIIVHLGCYDYCKASGVCEKEEPIKVTENKVPEKVCTYEYQKVTNGSWGEYGNWSGWTTTKVDQTDYRKVETKQQTVVSGSTLVQVGNRTESISATAYTYEYCPDKYTRSGNSCVRTATGYYDAKCPTGFTLNSNGTCSGSVGTTTTVSPTCPSGYTRSGVTCYKVSSSSVSATPTCPSGYTLSGSTCVGATTGVTYSKGTYISTETGKSVPATNSTYYYETVSANPTFVCDNACETVVMYTYKKYYTIKSGGTTAKTTPTCPSGYTLSGSKCVKPTTSTDSKPATCASGELKGELCYIYGSTAKTVTASCPTGFTLDGKRCYGTKTTTTNLSTTVSYSCPSGYGYTLSGSSCTRTVPEYESRSVYSSVTYYRYRERAYKSGNKSTEWSKSQADTYLTSRGFSLTGNKKCS